MAKLVILSGVPGSGKSYFSRKLRSTKGSHVYIISSDALRDAIMGNQQDLSNDTLMWKMYYELAKVYSADPDGLVVLDATHTSAKYRIESTKPIREYFDSVTLVLFNRPYEVIKKQNLERDWSVPQDVLDKLYENFEMITEQDKEFFDHIYVVENEEVGAIINAL